VQDVLWPDERVGSEMLEDSIDCEICADKSQAVNQDGNALRRIRNAFGDDENRQRNINEIKEVVEKVLNSTDRETRDGADDAERNETEFCSPEACETEVSLCQMAYREKRDDREDKAIRSQRYADIQCESKARMLVGEALSENE